MIVHRQLKHEQLLIALIVMGALIIHLSLYEKALCSTSSEKSPQLSQTAKPAEPDETITINGIHYAVLPPWQGNKVQAPELAYEDFKQIPRKFCKDGGKIYVTIEAQENLVKMLTKAEEDGILIQVESGYRSAYYQKKIFTRMLSEGREFDDIVRYVAPPGYSNHMLGTAVDFSPSNWQFAETEQYQWLQKNGKLFGFEETYSKTNRMKIPWESWHWQFIRLPEPSETATIN